MGQGWARSTRNPEPKFTHPTPNPNPNPNPNPPSSAPAAATSDAAARPAAGEGGASSGAAGKPALKWVAPTVGRHVMVQLDGSWSKGELVRIVQRRGQAALSVSVEDGATRNYAQKDEGKTWRRVAPAIG